MAVWCQLLLRSTRSLVNPRPYTGCITTSSMLNSAAIRITSSLRQLSSDQWRQREDIKDAEDIEISVGENNIRDYVSFRRQLPQVLEQLKSSPTRYQKITEREDRSVLTIDAIKAQCLGKYFINHRGCYILKTGDDMAVIQQLLWDQRPATVIELGTFTGGSAIWMADMLRLMEIESRIYSMDIDLSLLSDRAKELQPNNLTFLQGDINALDKTLTDEFLKGLPHPWLIVEDAHTNLYGVLQYLHQYMQTGDYCIVEDLNPEIPYDLGYGRIFDVEYTRVGEVGLNILRQFLTNYSQYYCVDSFYTDFFGYNGTWNWHGYIRRM